MNEELIKAAEELEAKLRKARPAMPSIHFDAAINSAVAVQHHLKYDAEIAARQIGVPQKGAKEAKS